MEDRTAQAYVPKRGSPGRMITRSRMTSGRGVQRWRALPQHRAVPAGEARQALPGMLRRSDELHLSCLVKSS